jgi:hypothetical protein
MENIIVCVPFTHGEEENVKDIIEILMRGGLY